MKRPGEDLEENATKSIKLTPPCMKRPGEPLEHEAKSRKVEPTTFNYFTFLKERYGGLEPDEGPAFNEALVKECNYQTRPPPQARGQFTIDSLTGEGLRRLNSVIENVMAIPYSFHQCRYTGLPEKQMQIAMLCIRTSLPSIVGVKEWGSGQEKFLSQLNITSARRMASIFAPRQNGKSLTLGVVLAAIMVSCPKVEICSYASNKNQATVIQQYTIDIIKDALNLGINGQTTKQEGMYKYSHGEQGESTFKAFSLNA